MSEGQFVKVFDVLDSGFKDWQFASSGLIFVFFGLLIFFAPRLIKATGIPFMDFKSKMSWLFRYFYLGFAILWTCSAFLATLIIYERHKAMARDHTCRVVEGPVENFVPMPYSGHSNESFTVDGVPFKYSDYGITDAFNNTASHGGPIDKDAYVRICYDPKRNAILRLEIRDFKGPIKNYAAAGGLFGDQGDQHEPRDNLETPSNKNAVRPVLPWYSGLFILLYFVDIAATQILFLPYIRTFFRIGSAPVDSQPIPHALPTNTNIKLRNTIICWDQPNHTIWLRPRGFNRLRLMFTVAKLSTDTKQTAITKREICFSSGIPIAMVLFFWTAFQMFSQTMPANRAGPSAGKGIGIRIIFMMIAGYIRLRRDRARMQLLVQDALAELQTM
jgi:hypothetical protein